MSIKMSDLHLYILCTYTTSIIIIIILIYIYNIVLVILMIVGVSLTIPDRQQKPIYLLCQYHEPSSVAKIEMSCKVGEAV